MASFETSHMRAPGLFDFDVQEVCDLTSLYMPDTPYIPDDDIQDVYYTLRMRATSALLYHHYILFAITELNITFMYNDKAVDFIVALRNLRSYIRMLWYMIADLQQVHMSRSRCTMAHLYSQPWEHVVDDGTEDAWSVWVFKSYSKWCQHMMGLHGIDQVNRATERELMRFSTLDLYFMSTDMGMLVDHYAHSVLRLNRTGCVPWSRPASCSASEWPTFLEYKALHFRMIRRDSDGARGTTQAHL